MAEYTLTITTTGGSGGTTTGAGTYEEDTLVPVTATASGGFPGNRFLYWMIDGEIVAFEAAFSLRMPADNTTLVAHFELSNAGPAQAVDMVRDFVRVSLEPSIPATGVVEMEATLEVEYSFGSGTFTPVTPYLNPYLYDLERVDFYVNRALLGLLNYHRPNLSLTTGTETAAKLLYRYRLRHQLLVDGVPDGSEAVTAARHAWMAGRPYRYPDLDVWEGKAYLWLSTRPLNRNVCPMEHQLLYVLPLEDGTYVLEETKTYANGTTATTLRSLGVQEQYRAFVFRYELPADWANIAQVSLRLAGRELAAEVLTLRPRANPRYAVQVLYGNSLGGFDSYCFAGKQENYSEPFGELLERELQPDHDRQEGTLETYNQGSFDSLVLRTGYLSLEEKLALKDMELRNHMYVVDGNQLMRVVLEPAERLDEKDGDTIHGLSYRARVAHVNRSYYGRDPRQ